MSICTIDVPLMLRECAGGAMTRLFSSALFVPQNARLSYARFERQRSNDICMNPSRARRGVTLDRKASNEGRDSVLTCRGNRSILRAC